MTEVPNILNDLELDPYEFRLYMAIKRIVDEDGACYASTEELCKITRIKPTKLRECKKSLSLPKKELNGLSLISIMQRKGWDGAPKTSLITTTDISNIREISSQQQIRGAIYE